VAVNTPEFRNAAAAVVVKFRRWCAGTWCGGTTPRKMQNAASGNAEQERNEKEKRNVVDSRPRNGKRRQFKNQNETIVGRNTRNGSEQNVTNASEIAERGRNRGRNSNQNQVAERRQEISVQQNNGNVT